MQLCIQNINQASIFIKKNQNKKNLRINIHQELGAVIKFQHEGKERGTWGQQKISQRNSFDNRCQNTSGVEVFGNAGTNTSTLSFDP